MGYYVRKIYIQPPFLELETKKDLLESFKPSVHLSSKYKNWITKLDLKTCLICRSMHGKIYLAEDFAILEPPIHPNCRCTIELMKAITVGTATINGIDGADWWIKFTGKLPDYYVSQKELENLGWRRGNKVSKFIEKKMLFGGVYKNKNNHLPETKNRIWYEADINYTQGKRNSQRILWSNDGLIFVTYDHYQTFYEIV
ncbi:MAG: minor capsid protein [Clostridia bacterium]|nr:minor capsid protein [Clostridia bacterium]